MSRLERRRFRDQVESGEGPNQETIRLFLLSRCDHWKVKVRAENALVIISALEHKRKQKAHHAHDHDDDDDDDEHEHQERESESEYESEYESESESESEDGGRLKPYYDLAIALGVTHLYVMDVTQLEAEMPAELSLAGQSKISKPLVRMLTKLNIYNATVVVSGIDAPLGLKLLTSDLLCQRIDNLIFIDPVFPERTQWIPRINPEGVNGLIFYNNKEDKTASEPHLIKDFKRLDLDSLHEGHVLLNPIFLEQILEHRSNSVSYEYVEEDDVLYQREIMFFLSRYSKQVEQSIVHIAKERFHIEP